MVAPGVSLAELATRTHTDPSSASVVVRRLVARGLVVRAEAGAGLDRDRRHVALRATAAGRALATCGGEGGLDALAGAVACLGARRAAALARDLQALAGHLRAGRQADP